VSGALSAAHARARIRTTHARALALSRALSRASSSMASAAAPRTAIVWFKTSDLRVADHEPLHVAHARFERVLHVFVFDPLVWRARSRLCGLPRVGPHRARFLLESVAGLRAALRARGGELLLREGAPEAVLPALAAAAGARAVLAHAEVCPEEKAADARVRAALGARGAALDLLWGGATLYHASDLPFAAAALPDVFSHFRRAVEGRAPVRDPLPPPPALRAAPPLPAADAAPGEAPAAADFGAADAAALLAALPPGAARAPPPPRAAPATDFAFAGGEAAAAARVRAWLHSPALAAYKATRNGLLGADFSSRLSPWLAAGCVSARSLAAEVRAADAAAGGPTEGSAWLLFELLWRDYMRFYALKHGARLFAAAGPRGAPAAGGGAGVWAPNAERERAWALGATGYPLVDASMRELLATGWTSNRGRQVVASWLAKDARVDWRRGAEWFESLLLDSDCGSNWGNWTYVAGVGADPREDRYFLVPKQSKAYDADAALVATPR